MVKKEKQPKQDPPAPVKAVVKHKDEGTLMTFDYATGKFYVSNAMFTVFPSKAAASRAIRTMCETHEPEFWRLHDVYEYEEE